MDNNHTLTLEKHDDHDHDHHELLPTIDLMVTDA